MPARRARAAPRPAAARRPGVARRSPGGSTTRCATCRSSRRTATSTRGCCSTTRRSPTRPRCCHPRPLRHPAAARRRRRRWTRSASAQGPLSEDAVARRRGGCCASTGTSSAARRCGSGSRRELAEIFGVDRAAVARETADAIYDQIAERARRPTRSGRGRCSSGSASRCWPPPTTRATTSPPTPRWPPTRPGRGRVDPDLPARPLPRAGRARLGATPSTGSAEAAGVDTGDYAGYVARAGGAPPLLHRARRRLGRPQPRRRRAPTRSSRPRPRASTARRWPARRRAGRGDGVAPAHAARDGPDVVRGRPGDDPAPGRAPQPPPARRSQRFGADTGARHPGRGRVHRRAAPAAGALRHPPRASTWCCSPSTRPCSRASSRRWPASTRRSTSARRGGSSTRPTRSGASAPRSPRPPGFCRTSGLHRRHPRVLLDPRPARHVPPRSTPASWPGWSPSTGSTRTRPSRPASTSSPTSPRQVFKL